jgi:hypothetical protein
MSRLVALMSDGIARICRDSAFITCFDELEQVRRQATRTFLRRMFNVTAILALIVITLIAIGWWPLAIPAFFVPFVFALTFASASLREMTDLYKAPLLAFLADALGLNYRDSGASPPTFEETREAIFPLCRESAARAEDRFEGCDAEDSPFDFWQARLAEPLSRGSYERFFGRFYAFARRTGRTEVIVAPAGHSFGRSGPRREQVRIRDDPRFAWRFKVYATDPAEARRLLDADKRTLLRRLRRRGPLYFHLRPDTVLVGVSGRGFRAGSMFRPLTAAQRLGKLGDDLVRAIALQEELIARLG